MNLLKLFPTGTKIADIAVRVAQVEHMLMFCGDGALKDDSRCSQEFRAVLKRLDVGKLKEYLQHCLELDNVQRGRILFDVIHDLGRRIGFRVTHGSYESHDASIGIWQAGDLRLDVKLAFSTSALQEAALAVATKDVQTPVLLVVSQDEPVLAAQIRGGRNSWNTRLVGCQALVGLAENVKDESGNFARIARSLLAPVEYTQVDSLLDVFVQIGGSAGGETKRVVRAKLARAKAVAKETETPPPPATRKARKRGDLVAKRLPIISGLGVSKGLKFEKKVRSGSSYASEDGSAHVCLGVSRRYGKSKPYYLFLLTQTQVDYMSEVPAGYYVVGCLDRDDAYAIPVDLIRRHLPNHRLSLVDGRSTWQVKVVEEDAAMVWFIPLTSERCSLQQFSYPLNYPAPD